MLNSRLKKDAFEELKVISEQYALQGEIVQKNSINLLEIRKGASQKIKSIEEYINQLANTPKEFEVNVLQSPYLSSKISISHGYSV